MSDIDADLLLLDILEAVSKIDRYLANMSYDAFLTDEKTIDAVVRNFDVISQAARHMPKYYKAEHPEIPWRDLSDLRHVLTREHFGLDLQVLWQIVQQDMGVLKIQLKMLAV